MIPIIQNFLIDFNRYSIILKNRITQLIGQKRSKNRSIGQEPSIYPWINQQKMENCKIFHFLLIDLSIDRFFQIELPVNK